MQWSTDLAAYYPRKVKCSKSKCCKYSFDLKTDCSDCILEIFSPAQNRITKIYVLVFDLFRVFFGFFSGRKMTVS